MAKAHHKKSGNGRVVNIYGDTAKLREFFNDIEPVGRSIVTQGQTTVAGYTRRRYPNAPGVEVAGHPRLVDKNRGVELGTMPGQPFWLERPEGPLGAPKRKVRQFSYIGRLSDLKKICADGISGTFTLRGPSGAGVSYEADNLV